MRKAVDAAARVEALAPVVHRTFGRLLGRRDALREKEAKRQPEAAGATPAEEGLADRKLDDAWKACDAVLLAGTKLTDGRKPGPEEAEGLRARVFGKEGLRFTQIRPRRQWDASTERLAVMNEDASAATFEGLGGARHLAALRNAHREFGLTFGYLKHTMPEAEAVTDTRAEQLAAQHALRDFVFRVSGQADDEDPESLALARFLLKPYVDLVDDLKRNARKPAKAGASKADDSKTGDATPR